MYWMLCEGEVLRRVKKEMLRRNGLLTAGRLGKVQCPSVLSQSGLLALLPFSINSPSVSIHIRSPTFIETVQVNHVYPMTSFVHVPPPVTWFSVGVSAPVTRVQPFTHFMKGTELGHLLASLYHSHPCICHSKIQTVHHSPFCVLLTSWNCS